MVTTAAAWMMKWKGRNWRRVDFKRPVGSSRERDGAGGKESSNGKVE